MSTYDYQASLTEQITQIKGDLAHLKNGGSLDQIKDCLDDVFGKREISREALIAELSERLIAIQSQLIKHLTNPEDAMRQMIQDHIDAHPSGHTGSQSPEETKPRPYDTVSTSRPKEGWKNVSEDSDHMLFARAESIAARCAFSTRSVYNWAVKTGSDLKDIDRNLKPPVAGTPLFNALFDSVVFGAPFNPPTP